VRDALISSVVDAGKAHHILFFLSRTALIIHFLIPYTVAAGLSCLILHYFLLSNTPITELRTAGIMKRIRHNLLHLLRKSLLQRLGHLRIAGRVRDFTGLRVGTGIVEGVRNLVLGVGRDL